MNILDKFNEISADMNNSIVQQWKNDGNHLMGLTCSNIPEEIIHAAGFLPIRIRASTVDDTSKADAYMHIINCSYVRSVLEKHLSDELKFFDSIVTTNTCDHHLNLSDNIRHTSPGYPMHFFQMYHTNSDGGRDLFMLEMKNFIKFFKEQYSITISDSDFRESIKVYNKTRELMGKLNELRKQDPPPITGKEYMKVVLAGMSIPKEEFNNMLEELFSELPGRDTCPEKMPRVLIMGAGCDSPEFINFIEDKGFTIVADNLCFGSRHYHGLIDEKMENPLEGITDRYFQAVSCASVMNDFERKYGMINDIIDEMNIQGIIIARIKFCDHWTGFGKMLKDAMDGSKGIPILEIEREYNTTESGQISTRLQAFHELIKG